MMLKVLIVDDCAATRDSLGTLLNAIGHDIRAVSNGHSAEQVVLEWQPDVVLMDFLMPLWDGCATTRKLRDSGYRGSIIIMSESTSVETIPNICGSDALLQKPVTPEKLSDCLASRVNGFFTNR